MVIEHVFVTTLEPTDALKRASDFLATKGFELTPGTGAAFAVSPQGQSNAWTALEMKRGKKNAARAKNVIQLQQVLRMEWDRGKVTVAMSIAANAVWGGGASFAMTKATPRKLEKMKLHIQLLTAIERGLEKLLAYNSPGTADYSEWEIAERDILAAARRRIKRNLIIFFSVIAFIATLITLLVIYAK